MASLTSVFIVEPESQGWIIERLMRDIAAELERRGISARIGKGSDYDGETVIFNSRFMTALSDKRAAINSLFITHIDDRIKEMELRASFGRFESFVCMSSQDADFTAGLKGDRAGVVGIGLPTRDLRIRPLRIVMFSARYPDGRKNEQWIVEYFRDKSPEHRRAFVIAFLGWGWESFASELAELDMNYELRRYSRHLPGEFQLYKEALVGADRLIYLGFDGGAMSVYDAIGAGVAVLASDTSYHRGLGESVTLFANQPGFFAELDKLHSLHAARINALSSRSIEAYVDQLLTHWRSLLAGDLDCGNTTGGEPAGERERQVVAEFRDQYRSISATRLRSAAIRWIQTRLMRF
jgi:hypothetical protein